MKFSIEAACYCHTGLVRKNNEDNFLFEDIYLPMNHDGLKSVLSIKKAIKKGISFFVFDGIGGEQYGEVASFVSAQQLQKAIKKGKPFFQDEESYLRALCQKANNEVFQQSVKLNVNRMGSTLVGVYLGKHNVWVCNVGDSRAFRLRNQELVQISKDHTNQEYLKKRGLLHCKPRLIQCLGMDPNVLSIDPYVNSLEISSGDYYLLCSDGMTDMVEEKEICQIMCENTDMEKCVQYLAEKALNYGGKDNITIILFKII